MKNLKKVLSLVLALAMAMSLMTTAFASKDFGDADKITKTEAVEVMAALGILEGSNGNFDPQGTLTREQAAKIITYIVLGTTDAEKQAAASVFSDVKTDRWSASYIAYCASEGYINGMGGNKFNPTGVLTGYQFGKMLLCALGYDATESGLVGDAWQINTGKYLVAEGLDENMDGVDMSKALSRENAAQLALNALNWSNEPDTYVVKDAAGKTVGEFDTLLDAVLYAKVLGTGYTYEKAAASDTLLQNVYEVTRDKDYDAFGRPGTSYTHADWDLYFADEAVVTLSDARMKQADVFKAIGAAGEKDASGKYITLKAIEDGTNSFDQTIYNNKKGSTDYVGGLGNGITVEVYETDTENVYTMVSIREYLGKVTGVTAADADKDQARAITVKSEVNIFGDTRPTLSFDTEKFAKGDMVIFTVATVNGQYEIQSVEAANVIEGKVTKISNGTDYTIGGAVTQLSQLNASVTLSINTEGAWYVDSYGNVIGVKKAATDVTYYYGIYKDGAQTQYAPETMTAKGETTYEAVKLFTAAGTTDIIETAWTATYDSNGDVNGQNFVISSETFNALNSGDLVKYSLDANGKIDSLTEVTTSTDTDAALVKGQATIGALEGYMDDNTVIFLKDGNSNIEVYTGYKNVPNTSFTEKVYYDRPDSNAYAALVITVAALGSSSEENYVYFAGTGYDVETVAKADGSSDTVYTYSDVYVNGVKATEGLKFSSVQSSAVAGQMYTFTTNDKTGLSTVTYSNKLVGNKTVTDITSGYFKADAFVYVDAGTQYIEVDSTDKTLTVVDALPAVKDYTTTILMVTDGADADHPATVVYFSAVEKD